MQEIATLVLDGPKCNMLVQRVVAGDSMPVRFMVNLVDVDGRTGGLSMDWDIKMLVNEGILPSMTRDELLELRQQVDEEFRKRDKIGR